jgi:Xaa-Pro dipeptidase
VVEAALTRPEFRDYTAHWVLPAVGGGVQVGVDTEHGRGLDDGDLIKFDCGTTVGGYRSDGGRTFAWRSVRPESRRLYEVLREAQQLAREALRPGVPLREVHQAAVEHVRAGGYPRYSRGHVGHSIGIDTFHEEPPYISAETDAVVEEGMVFAVEIPTYTPDVGAIMIEDLVVIGADGARVLHTLPHDLEVIG